MFGFSVALCPRRAPSSTESVFEKCASRRKTHVAPRVVDGDVHEQNRWTDEGIDCDTTLASSLVTDEMSTARSVDIDDVDVTLLNQRKRRQRSPMVIERPKISTL